MFIDHPYINIYVLNKKSSILTNWGLTSKAGPGINKKRKKEALLFFQIKIIKCVLF